MNVYVKYKNVKKHVETTAKIQGIDAEILEKMSTKLFLIQKTDVIIIITITTVATEYNIVKFPSLNSKASHLIKPLLDVIAYFAKTK